MPAPWLDRESLWRMVWLIKKRQRPTGEEWGTESTGNHKYILLVIKSQVTAHKAFSHVVVPLFCE